MTYNVFSGTLNPTHSLVVHCTKSKLVRLCTYWFDTMNYMVFSWKSVDSENLGIQTWTRTRWTAGLTASGCNPAALSAHRQSCDWPNTFNLSPHVVSCCRAKNLVSVGGWLRTRQSTAETKHVKYSMQDAVYCKDDTPVRFQDHCG